jgi:OTU-like cysteine protease
MSTNGNVSFASVYYSIACLSRSTKNIHTHTHTKADSPYLSIIHISLLSLSSLSHPLSTAYANQWLDVKDSREQKWFEAQVTHVYAPVDTKVEVQVHFKGYNSKWDERVNFHDRHRVALLHTFTPRLAAPVWPSRSIKLKVDDQLDALDTDDKWMLARVLQVDPVHMMVKIRYVDWESKYDEWLNTDSYRLAPLYSYTAPPIPSKPKVQVSKVNEAVYRRVLQQHGTAKKRIVDIAADGNCLFRAVSHQLYGTPTHHMMVRKSCVHYMDTNTQYFSSFVVGEPFAHYLERMRYRRQWGGELEISALSMLYQRPIEIYVFGSTPRHIYGRKWQDKSAPIRVSYHMGCHYNSVVVEGEWESNERFLSTKPGAFEASRSRVKDALQSDDEKKHSDDSAALTEPSVDLEAADLDSGSYSSDINTAILATLTSEAADNANNANANANANGSINGSGNGSGSGSGSNPIDMKQLTDDALREQQQQDRIISQVVNSGFPRLLVAEAYQVCRSESESRQSQSQSQPAGRPAHDVVPAMIQWLRSHNKRSSRSKFRPNHVY